ncbi:MAG: radical SAM protein [Anaerolineales bacterium]|nr:radical SAM protein [Anaerolineales bacterium]
MSTLPANAPPAFHLLAKPTGATCNLDCSYCFFLSKEMLYPGSRFRMADDMLETYIRQLIQAHRVPEVAIAWQGGEPTLMGLDFFRRSIEYVEKYRTPGMRIVYTIQTNGTLIDDEWASFFKQYDFLVGISIDGPRAMHDAYRVDKGAQPTFDKVMRGLRYLQAHGVEYNTLTTLHHANADHPVEVYRFLRDECNSHYQQYIPIIERVGEDDIERSGTGVRPAQMVPGTASGMPWTSWRDRPLYIQEGQFVTDRSVTAEQYGAFLIGVFRRVGAPRRRDGLRADV